MAYISNVHHFRLRVRGWRGREREWGFFVYYILTFITPPTFLTQSIKFHFVCTVTSGRRRLSPQLYINVFTVTAAVLSLFLTATEKCRVESTVVSDAEIQQYPLIKSSYSTNGKATPLGQVMMVEGLRLHKVTKYQISPKNTSPPLAQINYLRLQYHIAIRKLAVCCHTLVIFFLDIYTFIHFTRKSRKYFTWPEYGRKTDPKQVQWPRWQIINCIAFSFGHLPVNIILPEQYFSLYAFSYSHP